jgi:Uma2 family endonuclease
LKRRYGGRRARGGCGFPRNNNFPQKREHYSGNSATFQIELLKNQSDSTAFNVPSIVCNGQVAAIFSGAYIPMLMETARKLFTVDDYYRMAEVGIIKDTDRVELIEGEIIEMSPIGDRHMLAVNRATMIFARGVGDRAVVSVQNPASMDKYNEPQPDVVLIRPREDFYGKGKPAPKDVLLMIEVADTTLYKDRKVKLPVYARNGIREVWIVDIPGDVIHIFRRPENGSYTFTEARSRGQMIAPDAFADFQIPVENLLGASGA